MDHIPYYLSRLWRAHIFRQPFPKLLYTKRRVQRACRRHTTICRFSKDNATSNVNAKALEKDSTLLPVLDFTICHWSTRLLDLRAPSLLGSLSKDVFERRRSTGSGQFSFLSSDFVHILGESSL